MRQLSNRLFHPYRTLGNVRFMGQVSTVAGEGFRVMTISSPCYARVGDVVFGPGGETMILLDHPDDLPWAKTFKVAHVSKVAVWKRPLKVRDPVARVMRDAGYMTLGCIYLNLESPMDISFDKLDDTKYRFLTGQDIQLDDTVAGKIVKKIVDAYGVKLVECN